MFLDDKMVKYCSEHIPYNEDTLQALYSYVMQQFEAYYKERIKEDMENSEVKVILDKTFNLFNSFTRQLNTSENGSLKVLGELFTNNDFKSLFLKDETMSKIYNAL